MSSKLVCTCLTSGFCQRRQCDIPELHWRKCQSGLVTSLDELYRKATRPPESPSSVQYVSTIGTALAEIIKRETGGEVPCGECKREVLRLNSLTPTEVEKDRKVIVEGIISRGRQQLGWWNPRRWAIDLAPSQVQAYVNRWLDEAIACVNPTQLASIPSSSPIHIPAQNEKIDRDEPTTGRFLSSENQAIAAGVVRSVPRSKVLEQRRMWRSEGFGLPDLVTVGHRASSGARSRGDGWNSHWSNAFSHRCMHLGSFHGSYGCSCGGGQKVLVHRCNHPKTAELCCHTDRDRISVETSWQRMDIGSCESCEVREMLPRFISTQQFMTDIRRLATSLPPDVTTIAGVSRSGLCAATMLSMMLHVPLDVIRQARGDIIDGSNGWRLSEGLPPEAGTVLVVDDTCMTGNSIRAIRPMVKAHYGDRNILIATVYINPLAQAKPDLWAVDLPWPHILEWNLFNSVLLPACAFDFDGILCEECPPGDDDDGPRYQHFLENVRPLYPVRRVAIPMVITARLEKYRELTMRWLERWRIKVDELVMGPWESLKQRRQSDVAAFKAEHYARFMQRRVRPGPHLMIESDPYQAQRIAQLSHGIVVCPAAGRCF